MPDFQARDANLPQHRLHLMTAIEQNVIKDPHIIAAFYGGSIGSNVTDLYSDIDLRIVVKDEQFEEYRQNKKQRATTWGNVLYYEDLPRATHSVAHFDTFIKVDSFYYRLEDLEASVWLKEIKIIRDYNQFLKTMQEQSTHITYSPTQDEVEYWRSKFFAHAHELYRRVQRSELYYALNCLDHLRFLIVSGWHMTAGIPPKSFGDWSHIEGERSSLSGDQLALLESWHSEPIPIEIIMNLRNIIPEFLKVHKALCQKVYINENPQWVHQILAMVPN